MVSPKRYLPFSLEHVVLVIWNAMCSNRIYNIRDNHDSCMRYNRIIVLDPVAYIYYAQKRNIMMIIIMIYNVLYKLCIS